MTPAGGKVVFSPAPTQNQEGGKAVFSPAPTQNALGAKSFVQPSGGKCIFSPLAFLGTRSTRTQKPPRARKCIFRPRAVNSYYYSIYILFAKTQFLAFFFKKKIPKPNFINFPYKNLYIFQILIKKRIICWTCSD